MIDFQKFVIDIYTELALRGNTVGVHITEHSGEIMCNDRAFTIASDTALSVKDWVQKIERSANG